MEVVEDDCVAPFSVTLHVVPLGSPLSVNVIVLTGIDPQLGPTVAGPLRLEVLQNTGS